jgi:replicative DNA helicase
LNNVKQDLNEETRNGILDTLLELRLGTDLATLLARYDAGDLPNIHVAISRAVDEFKDDCSTGADCDYIVDDIHDLLDEELDNSGLHWRLDVLNQHMRGLRPGDFGIVAARPDKGKTMFLASEVTYLAPQLPEGKNILWLNNEGMGKRIIPRLYQASLAGTLSELGILRRGGLLKRAYADKVGGWDRIRIVDIHGKDSFTVEQIIERNNPAVVVYDMIDHIRGFGDMPRTDLMLEEMYKWARTISVKHGLIGLATSQISNEGDGMQYPTLGMLKDSKTGKQGACDFMLMIGASNDPNLLNVRYLGLPKNKLRRQGAPGDCRAIVGYNPERVRYNDIAIAMEDENDEADPIDP